MSPAEAGRVLTVYALAYALLSPLLVSTTGRFGCRRVIAAGTAVFALGALAFALVPTQGTLLAARALAATGSSCRSLPPWPARSPHRSSAARCSRSFSSD